MRADFAASVLIGLLDVGAPPDPLGDVLCIGTILLSFLGVVLAWGFWRRHRKSRRMPF